MTNALGKQRQQKNMIEGGWEEKKREKSGWLMKFLYSIENNVMYMKEIETQKKNFQIIFWLSHI